jgi:hypothetical protein
MKLCASLLRKARRCERCRISTGSLTFAFKEIAQRRTAALEVAALADYPVLLKVLG